MNKVIQFPSQTIDVSVLRTNPRQLQAGMIAPATEDYQRDLISDHTSEPIKSMDDIIRISEYLLENERYRDNMIFIVGINLGLRVSDLRTLRFSDLITNDFKFKDTFAVLEKKTSTTRKHKRNRYLTINSAVIEAVTLYLEHTEGVALSDYMFKCEGNRGKNNGKPITSYSIDRILKGVAKDLNLDMKMSTHSLRKTFGYHQMMMSNNDPRKLLVLQKMYGHSTSAQTLDYIGITREEMEEAYKNLNLGSKTDNYLMDTNIVEIRPATAFVANQQSEDLGRCSSVAE